MKARLAGIASHTGMAGVFRLRGSDIYLVEDIHAKPGKVLPESNIRRACVSALRQACDRLAGCNDLESLLQMLLSTLQHDLAIPHAMVLMWDGAAERLYTVASLGYTQSGIGSEIVLGDGIIGVAAQHRTPIRIPHMTSEYGYRRAIRDNAMQQGMSAQLGAEIPLPGLAQPASQLAVPILATGKLQGVLYVESTQDNCFNYDDEDLLVTLAGQLGLIMRLLQHSPDSPDPVPPRSTQPPHSGEPMQVKRYHSNDSVFIDDDYLIKGVAGAIFWRLLQQHQQTGRSDFCNRELRLDPALRLPDIDDNLEARLILLSRRLAERCQWLRIEKTGRGRFRLQISRPYMLQDIT
jgi:adenylate cyclase